MVWLPHQDHLRRVAGVDELNDQVVGSGDIALGKDDSGGGLGHGGLASVEAPGSARDANRGRPMWWTHKVDGMESSARRSCPYPARRWENPQKVRLTRS